MSHPQSNVSALAEMFLVVKVGKFVGTTKERKWHLIEKEN